MLLLTAPVTLLAQAPALNTPIGGSGLWLVYGLVLLAVAVALFAIEVFLPTGGLLGAMAAVAAVAGVFCLFKMNTTAGAVGAGVVLLAAPVLLVLAINIWPDTPVGQWVTNADSPPSQAPAATASADAPPPIQPGDIGRTLTALRPVGVCTLHGRRRECFARSGSIDAQTDIEVVSITGHDVYVRPRETPDAS